MRSGFFAKHPAKLLLFQVELLAKRPVVFGIDLVGLLGELFTRRIDRDKPQPLLRLKLLTLSLYVLAVDAGPLSAHFVLIDKLGGGRRMLGIRALSKMRFYRVPSCPGHLGAGVYCF